MSRRYLLTTLLAIAAAAPAAAENWPQWRGPKNDGHSTEKGLPATWGPNNNVVWKAKLPGPGASTPCIWGDRIFITAEEGADLVVVCIGTDGAEKWKRKLGSGSMKARGDEGNAASASCSTDGKLVYAFMGDGHLGCFDFNGNVVWTLDAQATYGKFTIQFGGHWTPVLYKDRLYLCLMHRKTQMIVALDKATGAEVWKADRKSDGKGEALDVYASPFIWENEAGTKALLIYHGNDYCTAHDLENGAEVWRVAELNPKAKYNMAWRAVSSPLVTPNLIVVPSCKNGVTVAIDPNKAKGTILPGNPAELWRLEKGTPDVPSPLLVDGVVYIERETSTIAAYDAKNGKPLYSETVTSERHRANPVYADGKIFLVGREGTMPVVKAGTTFELLAKNKLPDIFSSSPAVSGGRIYFRGWNYLWAIGTK
ncbi:PQQ-binding-like beta-propeller repeat protein [Fimbriiglobus ruber]|uniref:Pyrrolo-quinoline quinone repeat domain-containing protein n=1 Tax=Fimbriiglobus ruber TaxID=1908690 RepID=A0A225DDM8_9BACT|nr:PQQ-binding-like beta-propeller repeat protein [Fimbriiglobus ruber]OWK39660.1 hypothetical protein FRUB_05550 [Fimbriiglobus ruber]